MARVTLDFRHVALVLVKITAEDGEAESLEELSTLLDFLLSAAEQIQGGSLGNGHSGCQKQENEISKASYKYYSIMNFLILMMHTGKPAC